MITLNKFLSIAHKELGTTETQYNCVKYNDWYYGKRVKSSSPQYYAWCLVFICWCMNQAGISTEFFPKYSYIPHLLNAVKDHKFLKLKSENPVAGDLVVFKTKSGNHIGIVYEVQGNRIITIEGNSDNKVQMLRYAVDDDSIRTFIHCKFFYDEVTEKEGDSMENFVNSLRMIRSNCKGDDVKYVQSMLNAMCYTDDNGNTLVEDGVWGKKSMQACRKFQKDEQIEIDGIFGPNSYMRMFLRFKG